MPRRLTRPDPPLADDAIRLEPLSRALVPELGWVIAGDPEIDRFTLIPSGPDEQFLIGWMDRYERGWGDGSCAGFAVRTTGDDRLVGFGALVQLDLDRRQGEIGYAVDAAARGRGIAGRTVALLTDWSLGTLGLERLELRIDPANAPSLRVAERAGYEREGTLRNVHIKEDRRGDVSIWSRLAPA